jgi:biotin transport system substrate-specific component
LRVNVRQNGGFPNRCLLHFAPQISIFTMTIYLRRHFMADVRALSQGKYFGLSSNHVIAQAFWVVSFALFAAVGAQVEIPHQPVPYTFQTLVVILAGGVLGARNGFLSMALYLGLGLTGLPVFAGGGFGIARLLGPSGGYLLSFPVAAYIIGGMVSRLPDIFMGRRLLEYAWILAAMFAGLAVIFAIGTIQLNLIYFHNWTASVQSGFLIFSLWDVLKLVAATAICREFRRK